MMMALHGFGTTIGGDKILENHYRSYRLCYRIKFSIFSSKFIPNYLHSFVHLSTI